MLISTESIENKMAKSSSSQYKYREVLVDPQILSQVYLGKEKCSQYDIPLVEELRELQGELVEKIKEVISTGLTERQREVMVKIYFEGRTQMYVADALGVCQTTVHKIVSGNIDYANGGRRYGGALKKIRKVCESDERVQEIITRIQEINALLT